jgi:hypothetical protein
VPLVTLAVAEEGLRAPRYLRPFRIALIATTTDYSIEARRVLEVVEATALGGVAQILARTAESLAETALKFEGISPDE